MKMLSFARLRRKLLLPALVLLCLLMLCGCAETLQLSSTAVREDASSITAVVTPDDLILLDELDTLVSADFSGSACYAEILEWSARHPLVEVRYTVAFPGGITAENRDTELDLSGMLRTDDSAGLSDNNPDAAPDVPNDAVGSSSSGVYVDGTAPAEPLEAVLSNLAFLPQLRRVTLPNEADGLSAHDAARFFLQYPDIDFSYRCRLFGRDSSLKESVLNLTKVSPEDISSSLDILSSMRNLKTIRLGSDAREDAPGWDTILALHEAVPGAVLDYRFSLFDIPFTLQDEEVDISYHKVGENWPEVLTIARCMPNLKSLIMDSCGVSNGNMAAIRDALPETEVVWRIHFGANYSARTNVTKILASKPSLGGTVGNGDASLFRYFTKLKYLDIGHNECITDLSFVRDLPDLEVLIIAMNPLGDLTPLADCEKLEYLELFYSNTDDLSPLAGLKNLKHLNVGHCPYLKDISPIYDLELERFYLGRYEFCPVPEEQVDRYRELHPDCEVDNVLWESSEGGWRRGKFLEGEALEWFMQQPYYNEERKGYAPRYALLCDQFGYDTLDYTVNWYDPYFRYYDDEGHPLT